MSASTIRADEHITFFDTAARYDQPNQRWIVPVHGWIYEPEKSRVRRAVALEVLERKFGVVLNESTTPIFDERIHAFLVDNERNKRVDIEVCGRRFVLPPSAPNGHFSGELTLEAPLVEAAAVDGTLSVRAALTDEDHRSFVGRVHLVPPTGLSVISDIDDTIKVTEVTDRQRMIERTFLEAFAVVPGMADLYRRWASTGAFVHFVSSSPWHLYPALAKMVTSAGFPGATFSLKMVRVKDRSLFNLFKEGTETKPAQIAPILEAFPQRRFVLVGDSGEQDPEIYAPLMRAEPDRIRHVYIRNVTNARRDDDRFAAVFDGNDQTRWTLFDEPTSLRLPEE